MKFESKSLEHLQDFADLAGGLAFFKVNEEPEAGSTSQCQIFLGDFQLLATGVDGFAK